MFVSDWRAPHFFTPFTPPQGRAASSHRFKEMRRSSEALPLQAVPFDRNIRAAVEMLSPEHHGRFAHLRPSRTFLPSAIYSHAAKMAITGRNMARAIWQGHHVEVSISGVAAPKASGGKGTKAQAPAKMTETLEHEGWDWADWLDGPTITSSGRFAAASGGWGDRPKPTP